MAQFDVILVPTDFSYESEQAFRLACSMARDQFASVVVAHVLPQSDDSEWATETWDNETSFVSQYKNQFGRMKATAGDTPISFRLIVAEIVDGICSVAAEEGADLIVIGAHPNSDAPVMNGVTEGVLRSSGCPVLIFKQPSESPTSEQACTTMASRAESVSRKEILP